MIRKSDVTLVVSPVEQKLLHELLPESRVMILSNIHEPVAGGKPFAEREGLVFIGGFQHPPNVDAVLWYAQEILPRVRERLPGVKSFIVGSKVPATIKALATDDLVVTGYVPDVTPFFTGCRVSIAPLRYGAGVKGKVNLAMSHGLPVVATSASVEGMHLSPGEDVLVADDPEAFADAIARLYRDEALWQKLAAGGVENIRRHFSRDVARGAVRKLIALAGSARPAAPNVARVRARRPVRRARQPGGAKDHVPHAVAQAEAARLELGQRPVLRARREAVGRVLEQRLGGERGEDLLRVVLPVGGDVQVAAGGEAQRELVHERGLQQPPLVVPLLRPRDRERTRGCRRATRGGIIARDDLDRVVPDHAQVGERVLRDALQQAAHARRVHLDADEVDVRHRGARSARSSRPSRSRSRAPAAPRGRRPGRSRSAAARTAGRSAAAASSSARCCAGDIRPWRSTKLRIGRRPRVARSTAPTAARVPAGIGQRGARRRPARAAARERVLDDERVRVLPRRPGVGPGLARLPRELLAHARRASPARRRAR